MRKLLLIVVLLLILGHMALAVDYQHKKSLNVSFDVGSEINVVSGYPSDVKNLKAYLSFVPLEDERQEVISVNTNPEAEVSEGEVIFYWPKLDEKTTSFELESLLSTSNKLKIIESKPEFPLETTSHEEFLVETSSVDFENPEIRRLANSLASGEDDQYVVAHKMATWVNENIDYSLDSMTTDASQKASWVLENRRGVCDELTNLFIALCRSVGMPARFVSGVSYSTDSRLAEEWSAHGWAEVYFPEYGWVPFDVTYGQFGYIDPTHIKLKMADDANKSSTKYQWEAESARLKTSKLNTKTRVVGQGGNVEPLLDISSKVAKSNIGFDSYNVYEVTLNNPHSFYVPAELALSKTQEIEMFDSYNRKVLLEPESEKTFYYIFKISGDFSDDYEYRFKLNSRTNRNATSFSEFKAGSDFPHYSLKEIREYISSMKNEQNKSYSENLSLNCSSSRKNYLLTEVAKINCIAKNSGNTPLSGVDFCFNGDCTTEDFDISEEKEISFNYLLEKTGEHKLYLEAEDDAVSKREEVVIWAHKRPELKITQINAPKAVSLGESFNLSFVVEKERDAPIKALDVEVKGSGIKQSWHLDEVEDEGRLFILHVGKNVLTDMENEVFINLHYTDVRNRDFFELEQFTIKLEKLTPSQTALVYINRLQYEIENNPLNVAIVFIGALVVATIVLRWLFSPAKTKV
ncbi:MAG: transglutaminase-like domain-containing protein [Candidatus Nanoarchaeia archaeon]